ncbi:proteoglycan 3-like isoform X2 [Pithys albifrons albifrons]|uniref:proteoglycan 3-like isoform X2 n=1 Tax=Pithys albifrons albifrons TaxID=3385563 RepID=UPI003A5CEEBB
MWSCLLLALALMGTVPPSCSAPVSPTSEETEMVTGVEVPEEDGGDSNTRVLSVPKADGTGTCHYYVVNTYMTFHQAQQYCACHYHGRLASIHSASINYSLMNLVHGLNNAMVWIGAISQPAYPRPSCHWTDHTIWNYSHWMTGYPLYGHTYCTGFITINGFWSSLNCGKHLPFICEA